MPTFPSLTIQGPNAVLRPAIKAVSRMASEATFDVASTRQDVPTDGLYTKAVDAANVGMVELVVPQSNFDVFDATEWRFGVSTTDLLDALQEVSKTDDVVIEADAGSGEMRVQHRDGTEIDTFPLIDPDDVRSRPDLPNLDYRTNVDVPADQFSRVVRATKDLTDSIVLGVTHPGPQREGEFAFRTHGKGDIHEIVGHPDFEFADLGPPPEPTASLYSLDYVDDMRLGIDKPGSTDLRLSFAPSDFPFQMEFTVGDSPGAEVTYILAPRIQGDVQSVEDLSRWPTDGPMLDSVDWTADMDGERAKTLFESFTTFSDEYKLLVNQIGMESRALDPSNVAIVITEAAPEFFDSFTEEEGFPEEPIGFGSRKANSLLRKWRKNDDFEFAGDKSTRFLSFGHPSFTARLATIDPDSIREEPTIPDLELTAEVTASVSSFKASVNMALSVTDHFGVYVSDGRAYAIGLGDEETVIEEISSEKATGRGLTLVSGDYTTDMFDSLPDGNGETLDIRTGFEFPMVFSTSRFGNTLDQFFMIAPRVISDKEESTVVSDVQETLSTEPVDTSWLDDGASGAREAGVSVDAFAGIEPESISERMRERRLSTFPIKTKVVTGVGSTDLTREVGTTETTTMGRRSESAMTIRVADGEDIAVPDETIEAVLDEVEERVRFDHLDTGEKIADVTFEDEDTFDLSLVNVQPEFEYRTATEDGVRMSRISKENNNYAYVSEEIETPAEHQVVARATTDPDGEGYAAFVAMKNGNDPVTLSEHETIGNAYAALLDYVQERSISTLVRDAGGEITLTDLEVRERLGEIVEPFVDYRMQGKPGATSVDADFYATIIGRLAILPDAAYRADVNVMKPGTEADGYLVRYSLVLEADGPFGASERKELAQNTVGVADDREGIAPLVSEAFDQLRSFGDVYARTDRQDLPPRSPNALPGISKGGIDAWVRAYLPASKDELRAAMESHGLVLPFELTDVDQVGQSRADVLEDAGVMDMLDLVAVSGTVKTTFIGQTMLDIPERARQNLQDAAGRIWTEIIWPRRDVPEGFEPPKTDISDDVEPEEEAPEPAPQVVAGWKKIEEVDGRIVWLGESVDVHVRRIPRHADVNLIAVRFSKGWRIQQSWDSSTGVKTRTVAEVDTRAEAIERAVEEMRRNPVEEDGRPVLRAGRTGDEEPSLRAVKAEYGINRNVSDRLEQEILDAYGIDDIKDLIRVAITPGEAYDTDPSPEEVEEIGRGMLATWIQRNIVRDFDVAEPLSQVFDDPDEVEEGLRRMDDFTDIPGIGPAGAATLEEAIAPEEEEPEIPQEVIEQTREEIPYPRAELRRNVRALGLPVEFDDVDGMGTERIQAIKAVGIRDLVDLALVGFTGYPPEVLDVLESFPNDVELRLDNLAEQIHSEAVLDAQQDGKIPRRRDGPPGTFAFTIPADLRNPQRRIQNELDNRNVGSYTDIEREDLNGEVLVTVYDATEEEEEEPEEETEPRAGDVDSVIAQLDRITRKAWSTAQEPEGFYQVEFHADVPDDRGIGSSLGYTETENVYTEGTLRFGEIDDVVGFDPLDERVIDALRRDWDKAVGDADFPAPDHTWSTDIGDFGEESEGPTMPALHLDWYPRADDPAMEPSDMHAFIRRMTSIATDRFFPYDPGLEPEEEAPPGLPTEGTIEVEPVVRFAGDERFIDLDVTDVDLDDALRDEIVELIERRIDLRRVKPGEPLGVVEVGIDGIERMELRPEEEIVETAERSEAEQRAAAAIDLLER